MIIKVNNIHERAYDQYGDEIDYQSNKGKKGLKSYRELKTVSFDELANKIGDGGRAIPNDILDQANHLHPTTSSVFEFWVDSARSGAKELYELFSPLLLLSFLHSYYFLLLSLLILLFY